MKRYLIYSFFIGLLTSSCYTINPGKYYVAAKKEAKVQQYDAIIVPGVPYLDEKMDIIMEARIKWAIKLYNEGITKNIIFSGAAVYSPYVESKTMALVAQANGVPLQHIYTDTLAEHSTENLYYSYILAKELGFSKVALATDPFQSAMLKSFRKKMMERLNLKEKVDIIPIKFKTLHGMKLKQDIDPSPAFVEEFVPITERESSRVRFQGTRGKHINWDRKYSKSEQ